MPKTWLERHPKSAVLIMGTSGVSGVLLGLIFWGMVG